MYNIHEYFQLVLCWEVCPLSGCPLSEVSLYSETFHYTSCACSNLPQAIEEDGCQEVSARVGGAFLRGMMSLRDEFEIVGDVRGKGLMLGMELVKNKVI